MIDPTKEKLIGLSAAGRILGRCPHTVRNMIDRGDLEGCMLGGRRYTSREAIARSVQPIPEAPLRIATPASLGRRHEEAVREFRARGMMN